MKPRPRAMTARTRLALVPAVALLSAALVLLSASGAPAAATIAGANAAGTGPQPKGLGLGSKAALGQPTCSENGHTSWVYVSTGPFCVNPWPEGKSNGGATAPGVTATDVKVVFYGPNDEMADAQAARGRPVRDQPNDRRTHDPRRRRPRLRRGVKKISQSRENAARRARRWKKRSGGSGREVGLFAVHPTPEWVTQAQTEAAQREAG